MEAMGSPFYGKKSSYALVVTYGVGRGGLAYLNNISIRKKVLAVERNLCSEWEVPGFLIPPDIVRGLG